MMKEFVFRKGMVAFLVRMMLAGVLITIFGVGLLAQVNTNEPAKNRQSNVAVPAEPQKSEKDALKPGLEGEAEGKGVMNEAGYYAIFSEIRSKALAQNRYRINADQQKQLDQVVDKLGELNAQSFEFHYAAYLNGRNDTALAPHLFAAFRVAPDRSALYDDLAVYYELANQPQKKLEYCKRMREEKVYHPSLLTYARNLFRSVDTGAVIFTQGEWDTFPAWILQLDGNTRKGPTILHIDLLHQRHYFERVMKPFKLKKGAWEKFVADQPGFFRDLARMNPDKSIYLALTVDTRVIRALSDVLYTTGLAMRLSSTPLNNLPILEKNWKTFDLSGLQGDFSDSRLYKMNGNYLMPMGLLYQHYLDKGETGKAEALKQDMLSVARKAGREKELGKWL